MNTKGTIQNDKQLDFFIELNDDYWNKRETIHQETLVHEGLFSDLAFLLSKKDVEYYADVLDLKNKIVLVSSAITREDLGAYLIHEGLYEEFCKEFNSDESTILEVEVNKTIAAAVHFVAKATGLSLFEVIASIGAGLRDNLHENNYKSI